MPNNPLDPVYFADRFTTTWSSPFTTAAAIYARVHNLSYLASPSTPFYRVQEFGNGFKYDMAKLQHANKAANEEERRRFFQDSSLTSGVGVGPAGKGGVWWAATRGEKLRHLALDLENVRKRLGENRGKMRACELLVTPGSETNYRSFAEGLVEWERLKVSTSILESLQWLTEKLRELVFDEIGRDWEWRDGLMRQMLLKREIDLVLREEPAWVGLFEVTFDADSDTQEVKDDCGESSTEGEEDVKEEDKESSDEYEECSEDEESSDESDVSMGDILGDILEA